MVEPRNYSFDLKKCGIIAAVLEVSVFWCRINLQFEGNVHEIIEVFNGLYLFDFSSHMWWNSNLNNNFSFKYCVSNTTGLWDHDGKNQTLTHINRRFKIIDDQLWQQMRSVLLMSMIWNMFKIFILTFDPNPSVLLDNDNFDDYYQKTFIWNRTVGNKFYLFDVALFKLKRSETCF